MKHYVGFVGFGLLLIVINVLFFSCSIESPKAPSWDVPLNIPLINKTYTITEIADKNDKLFIAENGLLGFQYEGEFDTTFIGSRIRLPELSQSMILDFGEMNVPVLLADAEEYPFSKLWHQAAEHNGHTMAIPAFSFSDVEGKPLQDPDFRSAIISEGVAKIAIKNNLLVSLTNLVVVYKDKNSGKISCQTQISQLHPNESTSVEIPLADVAVPEVSVWSISGNSAGSNNQAVSVNPDQSLLMFITYDKVVIKSITARNLTANLQQEKELFLGDSVTVVEAWIDSGSIDLNMKNNTDYNVTMDISLPQITSILDNSPITLSANIAQRERYEKSVSIEKHCIRLNPSPDEIGTKTKINIMGGSNSATNDFLTLSDEDRVTFSITLKDVVLSYFQGIINEQKIGPDTLTEDLDIPDSIRDPGTLKITNGKLDFIFKNNLNIPVRFDGDVIGFNQNGADETIAINQRLNHRQSSELAETIVSFDESDNLIKMLNLPPVRLSAIGNLWIGDGISRGEVYASDFIYTKFRFRTTASLSWETNTLRADTTELWILPEDLEVQKENDNIVTVKSEYTNSLQTISVNIQIENHIPVASEIYFRMDTDSSALYSNPKILLGPVSLQAPVINKNGEANQPVISNNKLELQSNDAQLFKNEGNEIKPIFVTTDITLLGTNDRTVQVFSGDYIYVNAIAEINARVNTR